MITGCVIPSVLRGLKQEDGLLPHRLAVVFRLGRSISSTPKRSAMGEIDPGVRHVLLSDSHGRQVEIEHESVCSGGRGVRTRCNHVHERKRYVTQA